MSVLSSFLTILPISTVLASIPPLSSCASVSFIIRCFFFAGSNDSSVFFEDETAFSSLKARLVTCISVLTLSLTLSSTLTLTSTVSLATSPLPSLVLAFSSGFSEFCFETFSFSTDSLPMFSSAVVSFFLCAFRRFLSRAAALRLSSFFNTVGFFSFFSEVIIARSSFVSPSSLLPPTVFLYFIPGIAPILSLFLFSLSILRLASSCASRILRLCLSLSRLVR
mmetsp:Transcript_11287/g.27782  ORF Transcript_11287/g.27782 Transcript_11287/m.27782 type:complete len:223 (-) Transcript_11287:1305-1973(-)